MQPVLPRVTPPDQDFQVQPLSPDSSTLPRPLPTSTLNRVAGLIRTRRKIIGSRWRTLGPGAQALLTPAYLCKGECFAGLAAGFGISAATAWRRTRETIALLAARAPSIRDALRHAKRTGAASVILDGTLVRIDRNAIDRPCYSGKHRKATRDKVVEELADMDGWLIQTSLNTDDEQQLIDALDSAGTAKS